MMRVVYAVLAVWVVSISAVLCRIFYPTGFIHALERATKRRKLDSTQHKILWAGRRGLREFDTRIEYLPGCHVTPSMNKITFSNSVDPSGINNIVESPDTYEVGHGCLRPDSGDPKKICGSMCEDIHFGGKIPMETVVQGHITTTTLFVPPDFRHHCAYLMGKEPNLDDNNIFVVTVKRRPNVRRRALTLLPNRRVQPLPPAPQPPQPRPQHDARPRPGFRVVGKAMGILRRAITRPTNLVTDSSSDSSSGSEDESFEPELFDDGKRVLTRMLETTGTSTSDAIADLQRFLQGKGLSPEKVRSLTKRVIGECARNRILFTPRRKDEAPHCDSQVDKTIRDEWTKKLRSMPEYLINPVSIEYWIMELQAHHRGDMIAICRLFCPVQDSLGGADLGTGQRGRIDNCCTVKNIMAIDAGFRSNVEHGSHVKNFALDNCRHKCTTTDTCFSRCAKSTPVEGVTETNIMNTVGQAFDELGVHKMIFTLAGRSCGIIENLMDKLDTDIWKFMSKKTIHAQFMSVRCLGMSFVKQVSRVTEALTEISEVSTACQQNAYELTNGKFVLHSTTPLLVALDSPGLVFVANSMDEARAAYSAEISRIQLAIVERGEHIFTRPEYIEQVVEYQNALVENNAHIFQDPEHIKLVKALHNELVKNHAHLFQSKEHRKQVAMLQKVIQDDLVENGEHTFKQPEHQEQVAMLRADADSAKFNKRIKELEEYKNVHGNCLVPQSYNDIPGLGNFVNRMRNEYRKKQNGKKSYLTDEREAKLESVGFVFRVGRGSSNGELTFDEWIKELEEYKDVHGNCLVPQRYDRNPGLGNFVRRMRDEYRKKQNGKKSYLTDEREAQLESVGFVFSVR